MDRSNQIFLWTPEPVIYIKIYLMEEIGFCIFLQEVRPIIIFR